MKRKNTIWLIATLILLGGLAWYYQAAVSVTRIGLINYPNFQVAKIANSNRNKLIKVDGFRPDSLPNLNAYDMLLVFGMGIVLPEEQEQKIVKAAENGGAVFLQSPAGRNPGLTNITGRQLDMVTDYLDNGGVANYRNLLNYIRREIDGKTAFSDPVVAPVEIASNVLFYKDEEAVFEKVSDFETYCRENKFHREGNKKVVLFTSVPGPFNANREHINALIDELSNRGMDVYPVAGFSGRLSYMEEISPALIVYMPHGRLSMGGGPATEIEAWLKQQNVPVLCPVSVMMEYDQWVKDKQGMFGGFLGQSVTMPEYDGGIVPYAVFAQQKDENGHLLFYAIPQRLKNFGQIASNYLELSRLENAEKKIAIVYFKGPGKNALVASNMEVLPSLYNLLLRLKDEGYNLDGLPDNYESFREIIMQKGPVLGPYAEGAFDDFLATGDPALIPAPEYEEWCRQSIPAENYEEVERRYGKAPGSYMAVHEDTTDYLAVARVLFGNVALLPQPLPGIGENTFQLIHGARVAPPHAYIAPYLWVQHQFKAHALFHFGTHGSLEFTPGKQIALSEYDWTDPLTGTIPHNYIYTISNVGEGMIAKRRSYAALQTYLTPPFMKARVFAEKKELMNTVHRYETATGPLKTRYALSAKKMAVKQNIHKDLGLDSMVTQPYSESEMMRLANYLEEVENEKITGGLYTMGVPYPEDKLNETIKLMYSDVLAYKLAELDIQKAVISREQLDNKIFLNSRYTNPGEKYIDDILSGKKSGQAVFKTIVSETDYRRALAWTKKSEGPSPEGKDYPPTEKGGELATDAEKEELKGLIIWILPSEEKKEFIAKLESEKEYERALALLNPVQKAKALKIAKMIPAMGEALEIAADPEIDRVLHLIRKEELRTLALAYLKDDGLANAVAREKARQDSTLLAQALAGKNYAALNIQPAEIEKMKLETLEKWKPSFDFYADGKATLIEISGDSPLPGAPELSAFLSERFDSLSQAFNRQLLNRQNAEEAFASAVFDIEQALNAIIDKKQKLHNSPEHEFRAVLNALDGGYTAPSPGGDPVANPATIPTGRNFFSVNSEQTPTWEAWEIGRKLAGDLIAAYRSKHQGNYPQKVSFTLWSSSFIESEGATIAQILCLLGVEPVYGMFNQVTDVKLIPPEELGRPRIDVVVQTSGQLRDLAASRLFLVNRAIAMVAATGEDEADNFVVGGARDAEKYLVEKGFSPRQARELSLKRVFGGVNGNYTTGIMDMVESSGRWDSAAAVARTYLNNMGAFYGSAEEWGGFDPGTFEAALLNTDAVVQPRQSNTWGALSLDHVYEFMGGMNLAIKEVTGNDAEAYFNDFRNASNPHVQGLKEAIGVESRTTLLNPRYIHELMEGEASAAETFAETFRNTFGWNVMKPSVIENRLWNDLYNVYVEDGLDLDIHRFFEKENPYALQEMTAIMLETVRKGMWKATPGQTRAMAGLHARLVDEFQAGCSGFVCDNQKLKTFIAGQLNEQMKERYEAEISHVREINTDSRKKHVVLKKEDQQPAEKGTAEFSTDKVILIGSLLLVILLVGIFIRKQRRNSKTVNKS